MKIFNITNMPSITLRQRQLLNVPIRVGGKVLMPGQWSNFANSSAIRAEAQRHVASGALAIDKLPKGYDLPVTEAKPAPPEEPEESASEEIEYAEYHDDEDDE